MPIDVAGTRQSHSSMRTSTSEKHLRRGRGAGVNTAPGEPPLRGRNRRAHTCPTW